MNPNIIIEKKHLRSWEKMNTNLVEMVLNIQ